jgi:uncharacterized membrane protein
MNEKSQRSFLKTVSWRVTGSTSTAVIAWLVTGDIGVAGALALIQAMTNTVLYYLHERLWNRTDFGRQK